MLHGLQHIRAEFGGIGAWGPKAVADESQDQEEYESIRRDAYEQVNALLDGLGML